MKENVALSKKHFDGQADYRGKLQTVFPDAGNSDVDISLADGRIPCAAAVMKKA